MTLTSRAPQRWICFWLSDFFQQSKLNFVYLWGYVAWHEIVKKRQNPEYFKIKRGIQRSILSHVNKDNQIEIYRWDVISWVGGTRCYQNEGNDKPKQTTICNMQQISSFKFNWLHGLNWWRTQKATGQLHGNSFNRISIFFNFALVWISAGHIGIETGNR